MGTLGDLPVLLERLARLLQNDAHQHGLKPTQWEALRYLDRANRFSRNPGAVTAYLGMTKGTVSQTLSALERKGLIKKVPVPEDRRNVRLELTRRGNLLLKKDPLALIGDATRDFSEHQQNLLEDSLRSLLHGALQQHDGKPFGACRTCRYFLANDDEGKPHRCGLLDEPLSAADSERICVEQEPEQ